jgi:hypothetical protein
MTTQAVWSGKAEDLRLKLNEMVTHKRELTRMLFSKGWPKTPHALSDRLNEVTPNLKEIGIVIHREFDAHTKSNMIIMTNNNYNSAEMKYQKQQSFPPSETSNSSYSYTDNNNNNNNSSSGRDVNK